MASRIKGITIELDGETKGLDKALKGVNKRSRDLSGELKDVNRLLKFNPGNAELIAQKQKLLGDQVETTADKLKQLKRAEKQVQQQFENGDIGADQFRAFRREIEQTESKLSHFEDQLKETKKQSRKLGKSLKDAGDKMKGIGKGVQQAGGMAVGATAGMIAGLFGVVEGTEEFRTSLSKLEQNAKDAGISTKDIKEDFIKLSAVTDDTGEKTEALSNLLASGFDKNGLTKALDALSGAALKFPDTMKIEGLADGLQETIKTGQAAGPFAELLGRMGVNVNKFNKNLKKAKKSGQAQELVLETLANTGLAQVNEKYRENNKELVKSKESSAKFKQAMAQLGETLTPIVAGLTNVITKLVNWFNKLGPTGKIIVVVIGAIIAAMAILLPIIGSAIIAIGGMTTAIGAMEIALGPIIAIVLLVIAAIAALIAIGILLYKNWDKIKKKATQIWNAIKKFLSGVMKDMGINVKQVWHQIKSFLSGIWRGIKSVARSIWNGIKSFILGIWHKIQSGAKIFTRIKNGIVDAFQSVKSRISGIWSGIWGTIRSFINKIIGGVNSMIRGLNGLSFSVPDWVPKFGGNTFGLSIPTIPKLAVGTNYVKDDGLAYLHEGEAVVPKKYNPALGNGGGNYHITVEIPMDGEIVAKKTVKFTAQELEQMQIDTARGG